MRDVGSKNDLLIVHCNNAKYGLYNGDFARVAAVSDSSERREIKLKNKPLVTLFFRDLELVVRDAQGNPVTIQGKIIENLLQSPERDISREEQIALYLDFKRRHAHLKPETADFSEALKSDPYFNALRVKYGYAITCHKAQGGEWQNVIVKFGRRHGWDNEEYYRWCYTAVTRARKCLYVLDPPHFHPWSGIFVAGTIWDDRPGSIAPGATPQQSAGLNKVPDTALKLFGWAEIVEAQRFLLEKFLGFQGELKASGIEVFRVEHYEYQERYLLKRGSEMACIQAYYDARGRFTRVQPKPIAGASVAVQQAGIEAFKRSLPVALAAPVPVPPEFPPDKSFLKDCYEQIIGQLQPQGICVDRVEHRDYAERYHVTRGGETAVFDVWYNANGQGTSVKALSALGNSVKLLNDLQAILKS